MIIEVDQEMNVLYMEAGEYNQCRKGTCLYLYKAELMGRVNHQFKITEYNNTMFQEALSTKTVSEDFLSQLVGSYAIIKIEDNKVVFAGTDLCALERIYQYQKENGLFIFDNVYDFMRKNPTVSFTLNQQRYEYYLSHGYNRGENTYVEGLKKLSPGLLYYYGLGKKVDLLDVFQVDRKCDYQCYKEVITNVIRRFSENRKTYIMHSGGVDSNLLLCVAQELHADVELVTYEYCAPNRMDTNLADVERSKRIAQSRQVSHKVVPMHFQNYEKYLEGTGLFEKMPFEAHKTSGAVFNLFETLSKAQNHSECIVLCGQNNDSLYNLGPTELFTWNVFKFKNFKRGLQGVCQRLLISDYYVKAIHEKHKLRKKCIDFFVKMVFYLRYKKKYQAAQNCSELVNYFLNSAAYFAMKEEGSDYEMVEYQGITEKNFRKVLFKEKLRSFVDGNDNKIITSCADLNQVKVVLPYSLQPLIYFYYNMSLGKRDVFYPKDMCYHFVREYGMSIKTFKSKYQSNVDKGLQWDNKLKSTFHTNEKQLNFQQVIGKTWSQRIVNQTKMKKEEV